VSKSSFAQTITLVIIGLLKSQLEYLNINDVIEKGMHEYLDDFKCKLNNISTTIYKSFFFIKNISQTVAKNF
jgi:uncharacterized alpha-E superfamily protein